MHKKFSCIVGKKLVEKKIYKNDSKKNKTTTASTTKTKKKQFRITHSNNNKNNEQNQHLCNSSNKSDSVHLMPITILTHTNYDRINQQANKKYTNLETLKHFLIDD